MCEVCSKLLKMCVIHIKSVKLSWTVEIEEELNIPESYDYNYIKRGEVQLI